MNYLTVFMHFMILYMCVWRVGGVKPIPNKLFQSSLTTNGQLAINIYDSISLLSDFFVESDILRGGNLVNFTWERVGNFEVARHCLRFYA
jgi:hypothetical protein